MEPAHRRCARLREMDAARIFDDPFRRARDADEFEYSADVAAVLNDQHR